MSTVTAKERPILFSGPMVKAILEGRKTQTRRVVKPQPVFGMFQCDAPEDDWWMTHGPLYGREPEATDGEKEVRCPYGKPGDRLWVRETWQSVPTVPHRGWPGLDDARPRKPDPHRSVAVIFRADGEMPGDEIWRPSIHMPRWASRITLEITDVRVERLQDISEADAIAEGIEGNADAQWKHYLKPKFGPSPKHSYQTLWESINGPGSWDANPWIWAITFKLIEKGGGA